MKGSLDFANFHTEVIFYYCLLMFKILYQSNILKGALRTKNTKNLLKVGKKPVIAVSLLVITFPFCTTASCSRGPGSRRESRCNSSFSLMKLANKYINTEVGGTPARFESRLRLGLRLRLYTLTSVTRFGLSL